MSAAESMLKAVPQWRLAINDLVAGIKARRVWLMLAKMDIRQRYRRSVIGPFWITITWALVQTSSFPTWRWASSPGAWFPG
jgi:ABC-type polysaccharide/polyol phosphate export permease